MVELEIIPLKYPLSFYLRKGKYQMPPGKGVQFYTIREKSQPTGSETAEGLEFPTPQNHYPGVRKKAMGGFLLHFLF